MPRIVAVGTAVPPYALPQEQARTFARDLFHTSVPNIDRYLSIFTNTSIRRRWLARPMEWFQEGHPFSERNRVYIETACQIGEKAIQRCLTKVGVHPDEVDHLLFVSTSGLATPSIDANILQRLPFSRHVKRTPIWGLGCAGGAVGLSRAYEYAKGFPHSRVLLLAVELCSLTFRHKDKSKSNLVATSLFADGAAAVLVTGDEVDLPAIGASPEVKATMSTTWPDSLDVMGWEIADDGLKVVFSQDIPSIVRHQVRPNMQQFLDSLEIGWEQVQRMIVHPGGMKVLNAYQSVLPLPADSYQHARRVLADYGNMSSATVLFVLERELADNHPVGTTGILTALGPGFSSELVWLQW